MLEAKDTSASALQKKQRSSQKFFRRSPQKNVFQKMFQALHKILTIQKIVLSSSREQTNFRGLEASRPRPWPRTSKCVLEDSTSATELSAEVESRTQGSRPRTQKKSEAKAKDSLSEDRHSRGQGQECSRPRTQSASALQKKKKRSSQKFFRRSPKKKKKKVFTKIFQAISTKKRFPKNFSTAPQNFNIPKNSAVLEPRTGQFSRT